MTAPSKSWTGQGPVAVHQADLEIQNQRLLSVNDELRQANQALVVVNARFRSLYERAPIPYVTIERTRVIADLNPAALAILQATEAHALGRPIDLFIEDAGRGKVRDFVETVFESGHAQCGDVVLASADATNVDVLIDGVVLAAVAGEPARCVLAFVDITARKLAESARHNAQEEVLAIVSHDLRGPLNAIGLACDALTGELTREELQTYVAAIERSTARCERLIKDLLGVAHIESGQLKLEIAQFDVRDLVQQVCADHASAAAADGARLTMSVGDQPATIAGDRNRLHQVLSNLIRNALVHARGAALDVRVVASEAEVAITVTDDGPGIPVAELPHVFERYRQGARRRGGSGLGLSIVKGLVEAHHGQVAARSQPGHGACFEVRLLRSMPQREAAGKPRVAGPR